MAEHRQRKPPQRYGEWETQIRFSKDEVVKEKLWTVEDVIDRRGQGYEQEVLVKWAKWDGAPTWVSLKHNPQLASYLDINKANPHCFSVNKSLSSDKDDLLALKQVIFDSLQEVRYTPDGGIGRQTRLTVKVPFSKESFDQHFRTIGHKDIPADNGNISCFITGNDITKAIGEGWASRCYKTSTETFVNFKVYVHLQWGYKERINFDHGKCQRCHWSGVEAQRPELCNPQTSPLLGPPWIQLTFTRSRRNMVTGDMSRRRQV